MKWRFSILCLIVLIAGCGPKPRVECPIDNQPITDRERQSIVETARQYLDAPYKYTGLDADGFDCSGFVYRVYLDAISLQLPRSTKELYKCTKPINLDKARPGDMVFFSIKGSGRPDHIGIFLENSDFIHASKTKGVVISTLEDKFYRQKFLSARRLRTELIVGESDQ